MSKDEAKHPVEDEFYDRNWHQAGDLSSRSDDPAPELDEGEDLLNLKSSASIKEFQVVHMGSKDETHINFEDSNEGEDNFTNSKEDDFVRMQNLRSEELANIMSQLQQEGRRYSDGPTNEKRHDETQIEKSLGVIMAFFSQDASVNPEDCLRNLDQLRSIVKE